MILTGYGRAGETCCESQCPCEGAKQAATSVFEGKGCELTGVSLVSIF